MPMPRNNPGDTVLAAEWNQLADQIDTNTTDIADIKPKLNAKLFPYLKATGGTLSSAIQAAWTADLINVGDVIQTASYWQNSDLGGCTYRVVASGTGTQDGGSFINFTGFQLKAVFPRNVVDVTQFGAKMDNSTDISPALQAAVDYLAVPPIVRVGLMGGVILVPGSGCLASTINLRHASITFQGMGGYTNPSTYNGSQNGGKGTSLRWTGAAGGDMFEARNSLFCRWNDIRFQGHNTDTPRSVVHWWNDPDDPDGHGNNDGMGMERCLIGKYPWTDQGIGHGAFEYAILVDGANANNDRLYLRDIDIEACEVGIAMPNSQTVWDDFNNVRLSYCGTAIVSGASFQARNLQIQSCDRGLDLSGYAAVWIDGLNSENTLEMARLRGGAKLFVRGGYSQIRNVDPEDETTPSLNGFYIDATDTATEAVQVHFVDHQFTNPYSVPTADVAKISAKPSSGTGMTTPARIYLDNCIALGFTLTDLIDTTLRDNNDQRLIRVSLPDGREWRQHLNRTRTNGSEAANFDLFEVDQLVMQDTATGTRYRVSVTSGAIALTAI